MKNNQLPRRIRLLLAPTGSAGDQVFRLVSASIMRLRQTPLSRIALKLLPPFLAAPVHRYKRRLLEPMIAPLQAQLKEILAQHPGEPVIIFPPGLDWNVKLFQRPQQLALAFARQGALVFYVQPPEVKNQESFKQLHERFYLCSLPLETFEVIEQPLIYLVTWNRGYAGAFKSPRIIYDFIDEIELFFGDIHKLHQDHERLVRNSHLVMATAAKLHKQVTPLRADALFSPNAADFAHFVNAAELKDSPPADVLPVLKAGKPVVGYVGALAKWFDYDLLKAVAGRRPDLTFLLVGPDYDSSLPPDLLEMPNVQWVGPKPYAELPHYVAQMDVTMIPFLTNDIGHSTSPIKLFEYMSAGKPVVVTPMQESMRYDLVLVGGTPDAFCERLDEALRLKDDPQFVQKLVALAQENTWDARARQALAAL